jgi:hypothetical protein
MHNAGLYRVKTISHVTWYSRGALPLDLSTLPTIPSLTQNLVDSKRNWCLNFPFYSGVSKLGHALHKEEEQKYDYEEKDGIRCTV